jgi:hypothetical protein
MQLTTHFHLVLTVQKECHHNHIHPYTILSAVLNNEAQDTFTCCYIQYTSKWRILSAVMWHIVPCLLWPHSVLVPKASIGLFSEPCPFHPVPIPCSDILFYREDVNTRHTSAGTLRGISRGLVCKFQRIVVSSSLLGWLNRKDEGTMIIWNLMNYQTQWHRVNPFRSYVGPRPTLWFSCSWHFSSCPTDFSQQIAQVVLFLFFSFKTVG